MKRAIFWLLGTALIATAAPAHAQVPTHTTAMTSASAHWILGPAGEHRIRYASAHYYQEIQDGEEWVIALVAIGTCREREGNHDRCRTERYATHKDYDPLFVMDPAMQLATLDLGPHHVEWDARADLPNLTLVGVDCNPEEDDEYMGPHLGRETGAEATLFGRSVETRANGWDYGFLGRGAVASGCTW